MPSIVFSASTSNERELIGLSSCQELLTSQGAGGKQVFISREFSSPSWLHKAEVARFLVNRLSRGSFRVASLTSIAFASTASGVAVTVTVGAASGSPDAQPVSSRAETTTRPSFFPIPGSYREPTTITSKGSMGKQKHDKGRQKRQTIAIKEAPITAEALAWDLVDRGLATHLILESSKSALDPMSAGKAR